jgi:hypothetical protein
MKGGIEPRSKAHRLWRPSGQEGRTVCTGLADRPACSRGPSAPTLRTVRPYAADRPIKHKEPIEATREKRTVREDRADRPCGSRTVREPAATKTKSQSGSKAKTCKNTTNTRPADRPRPPRGPSAPRGQSRKLLDLEGQLPQIIIRFPKRLKLWRQGFGDLKSVTQGCYSPKILPPNFLNHRESRIL